MHIAWDIETNGLDPWANDAKILCASVVTPDKVLCDVPDGDGDWEEMQTLLANPYNTVHGHNIISFDILWWETHVGPVLAHPYDTRVAAYLLDETGKNNSLAGLCEHYGIPVQSDMKSKRKQMADLPIEEVKDYCISDTKATQLLGNILRTQVEKVGQEVVMAFLMQVARPLINMMKRGVCTLPDFVVHEIADEIRAEADEAAKKFKKLGGLDKEFNINSAPQLRDFFFGPKEKGGLQIPTDGLERTPKGLVRVNELNLLRMMGMFKKSSGVPAWIGHLLEYRKLAKLNGTYMLPLIQKHKGVDGRVHTKYFLGRGYGEGGKRGGTVTGRLSSSEPNLQNIPRDKRVKGIIVPTPSFIIGEQGRLMFDADYSQLELRVAAWYSKEPVLLDAFLEGRDIHTSELAYQLGRDYEEVKAAIADGDKVLKEKRSMIKPINFGMLYGGTAYTISNQLLKMGIPASAAKLQPMIDNWWQGKPMLLQWRNTVHQDAKLHQFVVTPTGRVRRLPDVVSGYAPHRERALRQAVNFMVQSLANDVMLTAILHLEKGLGHAADLLLTVHDSIVGEYDSGVDSQMLEEAIRRVMVERTNKDLVTRHGIEPLPLAVDVDMNLRQWGQ